ncbi:hypothetical protein EJB05_02166 [Eragrostis curvula]|uniref:Uncharacterized protein n=1 Tax=Eragrostis curvula TaxID=38414 RepID=A0A5J9WS72_9POAL|nr:hypothetical protein EJB05_02166 [Eragrostis curvula]
MPSTLWRNRAQRGGGEAGGNGWLQGKQGRRSTTLSMAAVGPVSYGDGQEKEIMHYGEEDKDLNNCGTRTTTWEQKKKEKDAARGGGVGVVARPTVAFTMLCPWKAQLREAFSGLDQEERYGDAEKNSCETSGKRRHRRAESVTSDDQYIKKPYRAAAGITGY